MSTTRDPERELEEIRSAMSKVPVRITLSLALSANGGTPSARLEVQDPNRRLRWTKVGPLLLPPDGGSAADLLRMLADLAEEARA